jgi:hypothetical protein
MPVAADTPQSAKGWKSLTRALGTHLPRGLEQTRKAGKRMVAATSPPRRRKG